MLAAWSPIAQSLIADTTSEHRRGRLFGRLELCLHLGMLLGCLVATPLSRQIVLGTQGWRVAFRCVGVGSFCVAAAVAAFFDDPQSGLPSHISLRQEIARVWSYLRTPTFCVLVLQGMFGNVCGEALAFMTMYFQVVGMSDMAASCLAAMLTISQGCGAQLGGIVGDTLSKRLGSHGRPLTAQLSVFFGICVVIPLFLFVPATPSSFSRYALLVVCLGTLGCWQVSGCNRPLLAELAGPDERARACAWRDALSKGWGALFGPVLVGYLAEHYFGYSFTAHMHGQAAAQNVYAFSHAMVCATAGPWTICLLFYSFLHYTYPRDQQSTNLRLASQMAAGLGEDIKECKAA